MLVGAHDRAIYEMGGPIDQTACLGLLLESR
jgi:hypothetical protein